MTLFVDPPSDDSEAKDVLASAYSSVFADYADDGYVFQDGYPNLFALGIAQAIGLMEGGYGRGFHNNWGAITRAPNDDGTCPADSFTHEDSSFETGTYTTCFRAYSTSLEGAKGFLRELYVNRPEVFDAALDGDIRGVAEEMYRSNYYMGVAPHEQKDANGAYTNVNNYIAFIGKGVDQIADLYPHGPADGSGSADDSNSTTTAVIIGVLAVGGLAVAMSR